MDMRADVAMHTCSQLVEAASNALEFLMSTD